MPDIIYPPRDEVLRLWASCVPVTDSAPVSQYLRARGIDPERVADEDCARALTADSVRFSWCSFWLKARALLIMPMIDHAGRLRSFRARRVDGKKSTYAPGAPKDKRADDAPTYTCRHLMMSNRAARDMARTAGEAAGARMEMIFSEGEIDLLSWVSAGVDVPVFGVFSGALPAPGGESPWAAVIPRGARLYIRTDNDSGGDKYASAIAHALSGRFCWRLCKAIGPDGGALDDNDRHMLGELRDPAHECREWAPPPIDSGPVYVPRAAPDAEVSDERATKFALEGLKRECDAVSSSAKGGTNDELLRAAIACSRFRRVRGGPLTDEHVRGELMSAAASRNHEPKRAEKTIKNGFSYGDKHGEPFSVPEGRERRVSLRQGWREQKRQQKKETRSPREQWRAQREQ